MECSLLKKLPQSRQRYFGLFFSVRKCQAVSPNVMLSAIQEKASWHYPQSLPPAFIH